MINPLLGLLEEASTGRPGAGWNWIGNSTMAHAAPDSNKSLEHEFHFGTTQPAFAQLTIH